MSLWSQFFGKDPKELFLSYDPHGSHWKVVSWNFDLEKSGDRRWALEVHKDKKLSILWDLNEVAFFEDDRILRKRRLPPNPDEIKALMNLSIHSTLKAALEENHEFMVTPVPGATAIDIQNETRYLQWIQATFGTLTRALDRVQREPSLIVTAAFFNGLEPETQERVLRLVAFNLDIFFYMKADQTLQILVFDDKGQGHGASKTPTFQQIIKVTKPQFYDEIVKLVHRLAVVGEVK